MSAKTGSSKIDALRSKGAKVTKKLKIREKPESPVASPVIPQTVDNSSIERITASLELSAQKSAEQSSKQNQTLQDLVKSLEAQINVNRGSQSAEPVRLKVHRDKNNLIEYIDVVPIAAKRVTH